MSKLVRSLALVIAGVAAAMLSLLHFSRLQGAAQRAVRPGELSQPHAFLENNCAACHATMKGVEAKNCIVCHLEHQGRIPATPKMDHVALARMGLRQIPPEPDQPDKTRDDFAKGSCKAHAALLRPPRRNSNARRRCSTARRATRQKIVMSACSATSAPNATPPPNGRFRNSATLACLAVVHPVSPSPRRATI